MNAHTPTTGSNGTHHMAAMNAHFAILTGEL